MKNVRTSLVFSLSLVLGIFGFFRAVRPWYLHWGATDEELARAMPLDDDVPSPNLMSTMAITIDAPPERIWPWLVQMGDAPRAGYYSYAWIERLMGMEIENSRRVLPEYQHLEVGDTVDRAGTMAVFAVEPNHHLVLGPPDAVETVRARWAFVLYPVDAHRTRLVTRVHGAWSYLQMLRDTPPTMWPFYLFIEPGAFIMQRKMLLEIRERVESTPA
jgi:hypothetical protein